MGYIVKFFEMGICSIYMGSIRHRFVGYGSSLDFEHATLAQIGTYLGGLKKKSSQSGV